MMDKAKKLLEESSGTVTKALVLVGVPGFLIRSCKTNDDWLWVSVLGAMVFVILAYLFWASETFKDNITSRTYHQAWWVCFTVCCLLSLVLAGFFWRGGVQDDMLVVSSLPIDKYSPIDNKEEMPIWVVNRKTEERFVLTPCSLYFEIVKSQKIDFLSIRKVLLVVRRVEQNEKDLAKLTMSNEPHIRPAIKMEANIRGAELGKDKLIQCLTDRVDADQIVLVDNFPMPFAIRVDALEPGAYIVSCKLEVSYKDRTETVSIGGKMSLYGDEKIPPLLPK